MMSIKATSYLASTKQILVIAVIRFVAENVFNHPQEKFNMYVCLCAPVHPRYN